jgi:2-(1,2-epoxy-1,2-dihydrophenyl)acetyl-CoA isomerase
MSQEVHVELKDGVRWIELRRPESRNGLTVETNLAIIAALSEPGARVAVIAGSGGHFCSGLDLKYAMRMGPNLAQDAEGNMRDAFHGLIRAIRNFDGPVVAAIDGPAVGFGCDMALACDLRVVSERGRIGEVFVKRGLMPDGGGTWSLPRLVGVGRALELMFTGDPVEAADAVRIGLANRLFATEGFEAAAFDFAARLAKGPPIPYRHIKQSVYAGLTTTLDAALDREGQGQLECLKSADFMEGAAAFLQKREPTFRGR